MNCVPRPPGSPQPLPPATGEIPPALQPKELLARPPANTASQPAETRAEPELTARIGAAPLRQAVGRLQDALMANNVASAASEPEPEVTPIAENDAVYVPPNENDNNGDPIPYEGDGDSFFDIEPSEEQKARADASRRDQEFTSHYADPETTAYLREIDGAAPIDPEEYAAWLAEQPPERIEELDALKAHFEAQDNLTANVHETIATNTPELHNGELPTPLAERVGDVPYAVGYNQSMASTVDEAREYLDEAHGIDMAGYGSIAQRFCLLDNTMQETLDDGTPFIPSGEQTVDGGFYNRPDIGRFVGAFPITTTDPDFLAIGPTELATIYEKRSLPEDIRVDWTDEQGDTHQSIRSKYVAGFLDDTGAFWENRNFLRNDTPDLQRYVPPAADTAAEEEESDWL